MNEAELLFTDILKCGRHQLYSDRRISLAKEDAALISSALRRRIQGEPVQYILGKTEFMGLEFKVNPDVLIPRQETEILVEKALEVLKCSSAQVLQKRQILEIGTGSGCIAIALAKYMPGCNITATDISSDALELAKENALLNDVLNKIEFIQGDLFTPYPVPCTLYDIIVSNPPYVASVDIDGLQPEIQYEPRAALDGGKDGLDFYRRIIAQSPVYLRDEGFLMLEIGFGQREAVVDIFEFSSKFEIIETAKDYSGIDRVIIARKLKTQT